MTQKIIPATAEQYYWACDNCPDQTAPSRIETAKSFLPRGWSQLRVSTPDPLAGDKVLDFCGRCTASLLFGDHKTVVPQENK